MPNQRHRPLDVPPGPMRTQPEGGTTPERSWRRSSSRRSSPHWRSPSGPSSWPRSRPRPTPSTSIDRAARCARPDRSRHRPSRRPRCSGDRPVGSCSGDDAGSSVVEAVIVVPVVMLLLLVAVQFALWMHAVQVAQLAASEGDRSGPVLRRWTGGRRGPGGRGRVTARVPTSPSTDGVGVRPARRRRVAAGVGISARRSSPGCRSRSRRVPPDHPAIPGVRVTPARRPPPRSTDPHRPGEPDGRTGRAHAGAARGRCWLTGVRAGGRGPPAGGRGGAGGSRGRRRPSDGGDRRSGSARSTR